MLRSIVAVAAVSALSTVASAAVVVSTPNTPVIFTFDADVAGAFVAAAGTGLNNNSSIAEPDAWVMNTVDNTNRQGGFYSTAASAFNLWSPPSPYPFAADYNADGSTDDNLNINGTVEVQRTSESGLATRVLKLATANNWGAQGFYLQIQNNTGSTINTWDLAADLWTSDSDGGLSTLSVGYAVDNGISPGAMAFTNITTRAGVNTGGQYTYQSLAALSNTISASVANGDYLVLALTDNSGANSGSGFAMDNLSITAVAVPEPASLSVLGLMSLAALRRRRA